MEKKCACDEILRLIKRAAEKASEERGYGKDFVIDESDLKKFFDEELRVEHAEERKLDTQSILSVNQVINASTKDIDVPRNNKHEDAYTGELIKTMQDRGVLPKGVRVDHQEFIEDKHKFLLAKADKGFKFRVYIGRRLVRMAAKGDGFAGVLSGAAVGGAGGFVAGSVVPGIGNLVAGGVGALVGAISGVVAAKRQNEIYLSANDVFSLYGKTDKNWWEEGKCVVYKVKYDYKYPGRKVEMSDQM